MFYSPFILTKKGALAKVWLAAHAEHKLSKSAVLAVNVVASCGTLAPLDALFCSCQSAGLADGVSLGGSPGGGRWALPPPLLPPPATVPPADAATRATYRFRSPAFARPPPPATPSPFSLFLLPT